MPLTASSPMEPPGKRSGLDHEAVGGDGDAGSVDVEVSGVAEAVRDERREKQRREQAFDQAAAGFAAGAVRHLDLRIRESGSCGAAGRAHRMCCRSRRCRQDARRCRLPVLVVVIRCAGAFRRNHQRADRMFRRALLAEQLALRGLQARPSALRRTARLWDR